MEQFTGWFGNKKADPATIEVTDDLARDFMASGYYDRELPIWSRLPLWLASDDGKNLAWDPGTEANRKALNDLYLRVRAIEKASEVSFTTEDKGFDEPYLKDA